ncbi:hypothetical protein [Achromobacter xylosoxidans]|uniref:hypothetical protein n=1 Tax=Alcaligenes xylosoxydans xylosoxydans TaxID=85698 RepID=UPI001EEDA636|nr:hypothetical protein [Achromobacter xylosoxidans]
MTAEELSALPTWKDTGFQMDVDEIAKTQEQMRGVKKQREAAMEEWKAANPERYQEALRRQRIAAGLESEPAPPAQQAARSARKGAGSGSGGSGPSSAGTLLTTGAPAGIDPGSLDLSKATLLGL